jgi:hypothetical protein
MLKATFNKKLPSSIFITSIDALKIDSISIMSETSVFGKIVAVGSAQAIMILIGVIADRGYDNLESVFEI